MFRFRWFFLLAFLFLPAAHLVLAQWKEPTPEELKMTSDPAAPDADAVYLYREEQTDDKLHEHSLYVRLKVLTDQGKKYADVEIPYDGTAYNIKDVRGRTIQSDGTVVSFAGKPFSRVVAQTSTFKYMTKAFSMPDVRKGSIIEYRYELTYNDNKVLSPYWEIQQPLYVHRAHYRFIPYQYLNRVEEKGGSSGLAWDALLPKGSSIQRDAQGVFNLDVAELPAVPHEEYSPPLGSLSSRVRFYYTGYHTQADFWKGEGKSWSQETDKFAVTSGKIGNTARELTTGLNAPDDKLKKIYAAVMKLDNTDFSRTRTSEENKAEGVKQVKTAADILELKSGSSDQLALLFIAMARAAGFKAYAMAVTNRDRDFFEPSYLSLSQLNDVIAIVQVDGKEVYFDPGQRYCPYGRMYWKHSMTRGLRQTDQGTAIADAPTPDYKETQIKRVAELTIDNSGNVQGMVRVFMTGNQALHYRQRALETDEAEAEKEFEHELQNNVPAGIQLKVKKLAGLEDYDQVLLAVLDVSGSMGTSSQKRVFLPTYFFEASQHPLFPHEHRLSPVDLHYPYIAQDIVNLHLPADWKIEAAPQASTIPLAKNAYYAADAKVSANQVSATRLLAMANAIYLTTEYPALKGFLDKVSANDQQPTILNRATASSGGQ